MKHTVLSFYSTRTIITAARKKMHVSELYPQPHHSSATFHRTVHINLSIM